MNMDTTKDAPQQADERTGVAERLRRARDLAGLSQGQAAKLLGMHRPTISEIEAGRRRVSVDELKRFADLYHVSLSWLMDSASEQHYDPRVLLAARELAKLRTEDVDRLISLLAVLKKPEGDE